MAICETGSCILSFNNFLEVLILNCDEELEFDSLLELCEAESLNSIFFDLKNLREIIILRLFAFRAIADAEEAIDEMSDDSEDTDVLNF